MTRSSELYAAGYADACDGRPMDTLCSATPSYREGFVAGLADGRTEVNSEVLLTPDEFLSIFNHDKFRLQPQPAKLAPRSAPIDNNDRTRQAVLFSGLDCLAGQQDLFEEGALR